MILELLDRPIAFHRCFVTLTGSVTGAVLLSQAVYWQKRCDIKTHPDGFWWKTAEEWFEETGLSQRELQTARQHCREFLLYDVRGLPAKGWYKVDLEALNAACKTRLAKTPNLLAKTPNCVGENAKLYGTETTPEITSETTGGVSPDKGKLCPTEIVLRDKELDRIVRRMKAIRDSYADHQTWSNGAVSEFNILKLRKIELKKQLGIEV